MIVKKIPPDSVSICSFCPFYRCCSFSPVLVPYDREKPYKERCVHYRRAVYLCKAFIERMTDDTT